MCLGSEIYPPSHLFYGPWATKAYPCTPPFHNARWPEANATQNQSFHWSFENNLDWFLGIKFTLNYQSFRAFINA